MKKIVVVGSINMDLVARVQHLPTAGQTVTASSFAAIPGGKGANQAVAAARLGSPVALVGRLGTDAYSAALRAGLQAEGIDHSAVHDAEGSSGTALIAVADDGANAIIVVPGANGSLLPHDLPRHRELLRGASLVLAQLEIPLETVDRLAEMCAEAGVPLILDPAPAQPLSPVLLRNIAWLTPNESETAALLRHAGLNAETPSVAAEKLLQAGARNVVLKLGEAGVFLQGTEVPPTRVPAFPVDPVDTTAAGDCFNAAFAVGLAEGMSPQQAARFACAAAALSTTAAGAQPSMPSRDAVNRLLESVPGCPSV